LCELPGSDSQRGLAANKGLWSATSTEDGGSDRDCQYDEGEKDVYAVELAASDLSRHVSLRGKRNQRQSGQIIRARNNILGPELLHISNICCAFGGYWRILGAAGTALQSGLVFRVGPAVGSARNKRRCGFAPSDWLGDWEGRAPAHGGGPRAIFARLEDDVAGVEKGALPGCGRVVGGKSGCEAQMYAREA
jgi:hypothetical protein